ncbi:3-oxoacyl-ACP reductase family protein [Dongia sp.]|uniref:3-oxoacyl-ACP reductase family protein n=1 Tax=Dongia sp. TaxID=1977262 RepID=UPI0035AE5E99
MSRLVGKVALVTGGSRGIGAAIVERLAAEGADLAFTYHASPERARTVEEKIGQAGRRSLAIQADSGEPEAVTGSIDRVVREMGRLDILVNSAGIATMTPFGEIPVAEYDRLMAVNVRAVFLASQAASKVMSDGGRIITIGSNLADRIPFPGLTLYTMSKTALIGLTRGLARDLGPRGITVNLVQPGSTDTDMNPADGPMAAGQLGQMSIPRFATPAEIAGGVAYLAGPEARGITGTALTIDGGFNI